MTHSFPLPPSANKYWRHVGSRIIVSQEARLYKATVGKLAMLDRVEPLTGSVAVTIHIYRARKIGDLDNFVKVLLDGMQGVLFIDDSQVVELHLFRHDDKQDPRVEVEVEIAESCA